MGNLTLQRPSTKCKVEETTYLRSGDLVAFKLQETSYVPMAQDIVRDLNIKLSNLTYGEKCLDEGLATAALKTMKNKSSAGGGGVDFNTRSRNLPNNHGSIIYSRKTVYYEFWEAN